MAVSDAHKRASAKWNASKDNIMIRVDKEIGAEIRAAAAAAGKTVTQYILNAVEWYMEKKQKSMDAKEEIVEIDEKMESWISLAYAIQAGLDSPENYPKEFQDWYAEKVKALEQ